MHKDKQTWTQYLFFFFFLVILRLALQVWKAILDETEKISKARVTASETLNSQVTDVIKTQKNTRVHTLKKVSIVQTGIYIQMYDAKRNCSFPLICLFVFLLLFCLFV